MEVILHLHLCSAMGETEVMNQTFELPGVENDPMNGGEWVILDTFTVAQTQAYGPYLATVVARPPKQSLGVRWLKTRPPNAWMGKSGASHSPPIRYAKRIRSFGIAFRVE